MFNYLFAAVSTVAFNFLNLTEKNNSKKLQILSKKLSKLNSTSSFFKFYY